MSTRRSSSSSSSSQASEIATATPTPTPAPASSSLKPSLEPVSGYTYDSCTYTKTHNHADEYSKGCYVFRSCQSCLEIDGCMVNDFGVCVESRRGMYNLDRLQYDYNLAYYSPMNYLQGVSKSLALPAAATTNAAALNAEQNWHFRAGEATYCSASDATCQECKQQNFYRGNDTSVLPDSRFCLGQNNCVCIQTCEVPAYKTSSCKWKLSSPSSSYNYYGSGDYDYYYPKERLTWWHWLLIVALIFFVHLVLSRCGRSAKRKQVAKEAREAAVSTVRRELGVITNDVPVRPTFGQAAARRPVRSETMMSESDFEESYKVEDTAVTDSRSNFVQVVDDVPVASRSS